MSSKTGSAEHKLLAIIPARGGSKGIHKKNLTLLAGKPLLHYTVKAALGAKLVTRTIISSDDDEILATAREMGAETWFRSAALSTDTIASEAVVNDVITRIGDTFDSLILLQPTSPLRNSVDIDNAIALFQNSGATALISGFEPAHHPLKSFTFDDNGFLKGIVNDKYPFMPRQDLPKAFIPNGAIYIVDTALFMINNSFLTSKTIPFSMSGSKSVDIDTVDDLKLAEFYLNNGVLAQ